MLFRLSLAAMFALSSLTIGCAAEVSDDEVSTTDDELVGRTITMGEDHEERIDLDKPQAIRVKLSADANTHWQLAQDGGLGEPKQSVRSNTYTFNWKKSALEDGLMYTPMFVLLDNQTNELVDSFEPVIVVGAPLDPNIVVLDASVNGTTVKVSKTQDFQLSLSENSSSGYSWKVLDQPEIFLDVDKEYIRDTSGRVGAPGTAVFTWSTYGVDVGIYDFKLGLGRGWQTPLETVVFKVEVVE